MTRDAINRCIRRPGRPTAGRGAPWCAPPAYTPSHPICLSPLRLQARQCGVRALAAAYKTLPLAPAATALGMMPQVSRQPSSAAGRDADLFGGTSVHAQPAPQAQPQPSPCPRPVTQRVACEVLALLAAAGAGGCRGAAHALDEAGMSPEWAPPPQTAGGASESCYAGQGPTLVFKAS